MTTQLIVAPEKIESELLKIWEALAKENKMRASLFNLIIFSKLSTRTDYIRNIAQKVVEKFPCRTLFISEDINAKAPYLKTAISVVAGEGSHNSIACDTIDIGVAGKDIEKVPSLILPHLLPDLPIYLLWAEDPSVEHPLFSPLIALSTRVIFDSEATEHLQQFAKTVLELKQKSRIDVADLNWARIQGWRDLIISVFTHPETGSDLYQMQNIKITYNGRVSSFFCHLKIQSMYLLGWLASRLKWTLSQEGEQPKFVVQTGQTTGSAEIQAELWEKLGSGTITSVEMQTTKGHQFHAKRIQERYHYVNIHLSSPASCALPYEFVLGQTATGQSLVNEICTQGTSPHYLEMLQTVIGLNKEPVC